MTDKERFTNNARLPGGHQLATMGVMANGERFAIFRGSSWSVIDLRATFNGIPKYRLTKQLKRMVDVVGFQSGILVKGVKEDA